ncbi:MAG: SagB/ThcOx family dehydrogenase [Anaerolineales bacterium]
MKTIPEIILQNRELLQCDWWTRFDEFSTDQSLGRPRPDVQKPAPANAIRVDLAPIEAISLGDVSLKQVIGQRRSLRHFSAEPLNLEEISFLLWATQGVSQVIEASDITYFKRTVPSGGNRHPFETYISAHNVSGLEVGLYRYLPLDHQLVVETLDPDLPARVQQASLDQYSMVDGKRFNFVEGSAATFIWTATPYRTEWRYGPAAAKLVAVDAGHLAQNLYLACGAVGAGMVAVGAFDRLKADAVLGVDGTEEFSIYMAPVGKRLG